MNNQRRRGGLVAVIVLLFIGIVFTILGNVFLKINDSNKDKCTEKVTATVVDMLESTSSDSRTYTPVFAYTYKNETYTSHTNTYASNYDDKFYVGSEWEIYINPNYPSEIYCEEIAKTFGTIATIFRYIGIGFIILSVVSLIVKVIKLIVLGGALGIAAAQTKKFNQQQAEFYGQQQWNNMNQGETIYFDNQQLQGQQNMQMQQGQQMQGQQQNFQQQGQGLQGLGNIDFGNK